MGGGGVEASSLEKEGEQQEKACLDKVQGEDKPPQAFSALYTRVMVHTYPNAHNK